MIVMLERGEANSNRQWGKGWEIQVQPGAVQSKLKRMLNEMWERRSLYIPLIRPLSGNDELSDISWSEL
jgi:hypothetical protein